MYKVMGVDRGGSVINRAYPVYFYYQLCTMTFMYNSFSDNITRIRVI